MEDLADLTTPFAIAGLVTIVMLLIWRTRNPLRQWIFVSVTILLSLGAGAHALEARGVVDLLDAGAENALGVSVIAGYGFFMVAYLADFYVNFDALSGDRGYVFMGRTGLAVSIVFGAVMAFALVTAAWFYVDPTIIEAGSNMRYLVKSDVAAPDFSGFGLIALDQTAKALLFDINDVLRIGFTDLGNNPGHVGYSLLCAFYRAAVSAFVLVVVLRLYARKPDRKA